MSELTGLCPGGWVFYDHSEPEQGPRDCVPKLSWLHYWPRSEPSGKKNNIEDMYANISYDQIFISNRA